MKKYKASFIKTLTPSDVDLQKSNQHELHGVSKLVDIFEKILDDKKIYAEASFTINNGTSRTVNLTWYNSRAGTDRHEYRLYYDKYINDCKPGDNFFIGLTIDGCYEIIVFTDSKDKYSEWEALGESGY